MDYVTWKDFHPEVAEIFKKEPIDWPSEKIDGKVGPVYQPCIAMGPGQELFVVGGVSWDSNSRWPGKAQVFHSSDLGRTWSMLCESPPLAPELPEGLELIRLSGDHGSGISDQGTIVLSWCITCNDIASGRRRRMMWMTRSEDRGKKWEASDLLDPPPYENENIGDTSTIVQLRDGRLMVPYGDFQSYPWPGKSGNVTEDFFFRSFIYTSSDDGKTWSRFSEFTDHSPESHLLELPSGKILASIRYQRSKLLEDPPEAAAWACVVQRPEWMSLTKWKQQGNPFDSPSSIGVDLFQNTAVTWSEDGGKTWTTPKLVTGFAPDGWIAQTGCLVRLSDGTIVLTFGRWGQRFMLSYDEGRTWSKAVYKLHHYGEYARSVVLEDDTIVTVHDYVGYKPLYPAVGNRPLRLGVLRWKAPPREEVEKHGFFTPREVEAGLK